MLYGLHGAPGAGGIPFGNGTGPLQPVLNVQMNWLCPYLGTMEHKMVLLLPCTKACLLPLLLCPGAFINHDLRSFLLSEGPFVNGKKSRRYQVSVYILTMFSPFPPR